MVYKCTPNLPVDSEYVVAWNQCIVANYICVSFTDHDLGKIDGFLLPTLVSVYGSSSVYRLVNKGSNL